MITRCMELKDTIDVARDVDYFHVSRKAFKIFKVEVGTEYHLLMTVIYISRSSLFFSLSVRILSRSGENKSGGSRRETSQITLRDGLN